MMKPTIHMNGTSRDELYGQMIKAHRATGLALDALRAAAPHGRDYYLQGPAAIVQATREHFDRLDRIEGVRAELLELCESF